MRNGLYNFDVIISYAHATYYVENKHKWLHVCCDLLESDAFVCKWVQFITFHDRLNINTVLFISVFNYKCLMGCSPPEMPRCWHVGGFGKLFTFCLPDREFYQSFLWGFLLFSFTKLPNL